jgi:hypothetical protein
MNIIQTLPDTILMVSKRTVSKILKRANAKCSLCGWCESTCDIHHILPKSKGGSDKMDNLICVCPNCHRSLHEHKSLFKTVDELKQLSLEKTLPNWKDFYKPEASAISRVCNNNGIKYLPNSCRICGNPTLSHINFCSEECLFKHRQKLSITKEELEKIVLEKPFTQIGKMFGVSDNTIRDRCKKYGIEIPKIPKGYWLKKK